MSQLRRNVVANFIARGFVTVANLAFVPLYLRLMGLDASGLIGFGVILNAAIQLMDMGLSTTLNREMASLSTDDARSADARNLVRTFEIVYWPIALLIALGIAGAAPAIARNWFSSQHLSVLTIQRAVVMMGLSIALQWPFSLYEGGLMGLQKQILMNAISTTGAVLRTLGALAVLLIVGKSVEVFFAWQIVVSAALTVAVYIALWRSLPGGIGRPKFDRKALIRVQAFAAGVMGASVAAFAVSQCDRIILSRQVRLDIFGCYTTAAQLSGALLFAANPFFVALFPRLVQLIAQDDGELKPLYHRSCQLLSVVVLPLAAVLTLYAPDLTRVLEVWTGKPLHIAHMDRILALLAVGFAANALMNIPYALQLAAGWTRLAIVQNVVTVCVQVPMTFWLISKWGAAGAAFVWMAVNLSYLAIMVPIMHRRLLKGEAKRWYLDDVGRPLAGALFIAGIARLWAPAHEAELLTLARIVSICAAAMLAALAVSPVALQLVRRRLPGRAASGAL